MSGAKWLAFAGPQAANRMAGDPKRQSCLCAAAYMTEALEQYRRYAFADGLLCRTDDSVGNNAGSVFSAVRTGRQVNAGPKSPWLSQRCTYMLAM